MIINYGKFVEHDIEDFKETDFYDYLSKLVLKYESYKLSDELYELLNTFKRNHAIFYINLEKYEKHFTRKDVVVKDKNIYSEITTFEFDINLILKDLLDMKLYKKLDDNTFNDKIREYEEKQILKKIRFLKSIKIEREFDQNDDIITNKIEKINGHKLFDITLYPSYCTKLQLTKLDNIEFTYVMGVFVNFRKDKKKIFMEFNDVKTALVIINKRKYKKSKLKEKFSLSYYKCIGKVILGVTSYNYLNSILKED